MENKIYADLERGYSVWLEPTHLHFHTGGRVEVKALWGSRMQKDGTGNPENWEVSVTDPAGNALNAGISYGEGLYAGVYFQAGEEGLYHVVVTNKVGTHQEDYYEQRAGLLVPVGHHIHGSGVAAGQGLEIVPAQFKEFHPGDTISLQVLMNGKPVHGAEVKATYHLFEGTGYPYSKTTDNEGKVSFTFDNKGHWMFLVTLEEKPTKDGFIKNYTSTFVVPGVR